MAHYKKDGSLDMRYSSSKQAVASGWGSSSGSQSSSYSSYAQPSYSGSDLHYKKDGSLDMRYGSSKQAASSGYGHSSSYDTSSYRSYAEPSYSGSDLHYKKDGSLDMRYGSSKQAASSGYGHSPSYDTSSYGSYSRQPASGLSDVHLKKDGTLDMRYSSSKQAASSGYGNYETPSSSSNRSSARQSAALSDIHLKKDGTLDMRYSSSKQAASGGFDPFYGDDYHYKKDGTLDMRYASSKKAAPKSSDYSSTSSYAGGGSSGMHLKKDGTLDMRFASSKAAVANSSDLTSAFKGIKMATYDHNIPTHVPRKKDGTPDMRTKAAKDWVAQQATVNQGGALPTWVPRIKDGNIDLSKAIGRMFLGTQSAQYQPMRQREKYWSDKCLNNNIFNRLVREQRGEDVRLPQTPKFVFCETQTGQETISEYDDMSSTAEGASVLQDMIKEWGTYDYRSSTAEKERVFQDIIKELENIRVYSTRQYQPSGINIPKNIPQLESTSIIFEKGEAGILGKGGFGVVVKAKWEGKPVAVKQLHLDQLTRKDKVSFVNELRILNQLGKHENLVLFHGYCLKPLCIVMELVELGNLKYLLHYCVKPEVEAKMTDGRIKKIIIFDIVNGMRQLHVAKIVHGDIKPQNILITKDYRAKIADFGLATFRGKTSCLVDSRKMSDDDEEPHLVGGTAAYMAPELLDSTSPPDYPSDVYSFGIVLNELVSETEPYFDQGDNIRGRGPFAVTNYAKQGKRPTIKKDQPQKLLQLIERCWSKNPSSRPTFDRIHEEILDVDFVVKDSFAL